MAETGKFLCYRLQALRVYVGDPLTRIGVYTEKISNGRWHCNFCRVHGKPKVSADLNHGVDIVLAIPSTSGPAVK